MKRPGKMLKEVLETIFKKPATVNYPHDKSGMPDHFRGAIKFIPEKCIGCKLCVKDCPSGAITINKVGDKMFEAVFQLDKCIYCAQCVDSCAKDALEATKEFELAQLDRKNFKVTFNAKPRPAPEAKPEEKAPESK